MKKYLVTGGEGFIGSKIARETGGVSFDIKSGHDILNTEDLCASAAEAGGIFHCAAKISVPESLLIPGEYHRTNVEGTQSVVEAAEKNNLKIVFSSSAAVYGDSDTPVHEESILNPKSPYAENKRDAEELMKKSKIKGIALRYFNVYGPGQSAQYAGVITAFIKNALQGKDIIIYGNGEQVRDFIFVEDIVRANMLAMEYQNEKFEVFNIASGTKTTIRQLAEMIIALTKSSSKIDYQPARAGDILYSQADASKAKNILGWTPQVSLEEGLKKTIESY